MIICHGAVGGASGSYSRSPSFAEVQEQRSFTKRMEQQELDRLQQRFAPALEAANVPFQVTLQRAGLPVTLCWCGANNHSALSQCQDSGMLRTSI